MRRTYSIQVVIDAAGEDDGLEWISDALQQQNDEVDARGLEWYMRWSEEVELLHPPEPDPWNSPEPLVTDDFNV